MDSVLTRKIKALLFIEKEMDYREKYWLIPKIKAFFII